MQISVPLIEIISWRLTAEVIRRAPDQLRVIETHPSGGQYDCLSFLSLNGRHIADLNRRGRFHVCEPLHGTAQFQPWDLWTDAITEDDPLRVVDGLCQRIGLAVPAKLPPSTPMVLAYRFIADFLTHSVLGRTRWECRNGFEDTSGWGGGPRLGWFELFSGAAERVKQRLDDDVLSQPAYRFWFLCQNEEPILCLETTGLVWNRTGGPIDLVKEYSGDRRIWPSVMKAALDRLP